MIGSNDNLSLRYHTITFEWWDEPGELNGCYLVSLFAGGVTEPLDARICATKDEAFDFARQIMEVYPQALFRDQTGGGAV